jgi:membrane protease YdiL (CAAX protease family)
VDCVARGLVFRCPNVSCLVGCTASQLREILRLITDAPHLPGSDALLVGLMLTRAVILAPIGEELLFRGVFFSWLRQRHSLPVSALVSSTLFSAVHTYPRLYLFAFLYGLGACWVRERTGQVGSLIVVHVLNSTALLALALSVHA